MPRIFPFFLIKRPPSSTNPKKERTQENKAMAAARLLRGSIRHVPSPSTATTATTTGSSSLGAVKCVGKTAHGSTGGRCDQRGVSTVARVKRSSSESFMVATEPRVDRVVIDMASLVAALYNALIKQLRSSLKRKPWKLQVQSLLERAIIDCRFFTVFAVAGSLLGSVLCFLEGSFLVIESYLHYFNILSKSSDSGHMMHLLIEAIDMFLVGTAMLMFGIGLYVMFVGSKTAKENRLSLPGSNLFGLFHFKTLPTWVEMQSVSQAKTRIGHAVMMILQVGLLEKFKTIPLVTSLDLACFAAAVLVSSACIFLLSRLSNGVN